MSQIIVPTYRTEAGVHSNPAVSQLAFTSCVDGLYTVNKKFKEVFIYWTGAAWAESATWNPLLLNIRVALRVDNVCDDTFSYLNIGFNDFRTLAQCCITQGIFVPAFSPQFI